MNKGLLVLSMSVLVSNGVLAEKVGRFYAGGALGITNLEADYIKDEDTISLQIFGGYRFHKYVAVEGRLTNFGDMGGDDITGVTVHALGIYPVGNQGFDIYGQLGLGQARSGSDTAMMASIGIGGRYTPPSLPQLTVNVGLDRYGAEFQDVDVDFGINVVDIREVDIKFRATMLRIGAKYNF